MMEYWVWLQTVLKPGSAKVIPVLERYGNAKAVFDTSYDDLKLSGLFFGKRIVHIKKEKFVRSPKGFK